MNCIAPHFPAALTCLLAFAVSRAATQEVRLDVPTRAVLILANLNNTQYLGTVEQLNAKLVRFKPLNAAVDHRNLACDVSKASIKCRSRCCAARLTRR